VQRIGSNGSGLALSLQGLLPQQAEGMTPYLARETPLAVHMFRHTGQTLPTWSRQGQPPWRREVHSRVGVGLETYSERLSRCDRRTLPLAEEENTTRLAASVFFLNYL
jgi:hypothetical protein